MHSMVICTILIKTIVIESIEHTGTYTFTEREQEIDRERERERERETFTFRPYMHSFKETF